MRVNINRRVRLAAAAVLAVVLAQGAVPLANERVRRLGDHLKCKCGCNASITGCNMINCHFSDPVRLKLLQMTEQGRSDDEIYAEMVSVYGKDILLDPPQEGFFLMSWMMPAAGLAGGLGLVYLLLARWRRRPAAVAAVTASPELERYRGRIEDDLSKLE